MNLGELVEEIQINLGTRTDTETEASIKKAINWILREELPSRGLESFLTEDPSLLKTIIGQEYVVLPDGFGGVCKNGFAIESGNNYIPLTPMNTVRLHTRDSGTPSKFKVLSGFEWGIPTGRMWAYLRPIPNAEKNLHLWYYWKQTTLTSPTHEALISKIYGDSPIISGATWWINKSLHDIEQEAKWYAYYEKDVANLLDWQSKLEGEPVIEAGPYDHFSDSELPSDYQD